MVIPAYFILKKGEIIMESMNCIKVLLDEFIEYGRRQAENIAMAHAAKKLRKAILNGGTDCEEEISDLEYAAIANGFYAGFRAVRQLLTR